MLFSPVVIASIILGIALVLVLRLVINAARAQRIEDNDQLIAAKNAEATALGGGSQNAGAAAQNEDELKGLAKRLHQAGIKQSPGTFRLLVAAIAFFGFFLSLVLAHSIIISLIVVVCVIVASHFFINHQIKRQKLVFEEQFGRACSQIAGSIRTGLTIDRAIRSVAAYMDDPLRSEFMIVAAECTYDPDVAAALKRMAIRMESSDAMLFASMIDLNQRKGGKLADSVERLSETISTRQAMRRHIRAESTSGKTAGIAVVVITALLIVMMFIVNPQFLEFYQYNPFGPICAIAAAALFALGTFLITRMTDFDMS